MLDILRWYDICAGFFILATTAAIFWEARTFDIVPIMPKKGHDYIPLKRRVMGLLLLLFTLPMDMRLFKIKWHVRMIIVGNTLLVMSHMVERYNKLGKEPDSLRLFNLEVLEPIAAAVALTFEFVALVIMWWHYYDRRTSPVEERSRH